MSEGPCLPERVDLTSPLIDLERVHRLYPEVLRAVLAYDDKVTIYWQRTWQRWCLAHTGWNGTFRFYTWPNPRLSMQIIRFLEDSDQWKRRQPTARQEMDEDLERRSKRSEKLRDDFRHAARLNRRQVSRAYTLADTHLGGVVVG